MTTTYGAGRKPVRETTCARCRALAVERADDFPQSEAAPDPCNLCHWWGWPENEPCCCLLPHREM